MCGEKSSENEKNPLWAWWLIYSFGWKMEGDSESVDYDVPKNQSNFIGI
jgi:hypothetical protein